MTGITVLLSLTVFMLLVAEIMPATSDSVPLIGEWSCPSQRGGWGLSACFVSVQTWKWLAQMERNDGRGFRDPENRDAAKCICHIHGYVSSANGPVRNEYNHSLWNGSCWCCLFPNVERENPSHNAKDKTILISTAQPILKATNYY